MAYSPSYMWEKNTKHFDKTRVRSYYVTFDPAKPYLLRGETIGIAAQNHTFCTLISYV